MESQSLRRRADERIIVVHSFCLLTSERDSGGSTDGSVSENGGAMLNNSPIISINGMVRPSGKVISLPFALPGAERRLGNTELFGGFNNF